MRNSIVSITVCVQEALGNTLLYVCVQEALGNTLLYVTQNKVSIFYMYIQYNTLKTYVYSYKPLYLAGQQRQM